MHIFHSCRAKPYLYYFLLNTAEDIKKEKKKKKVQDLTTKHSHSLVSDGSVSLPMNHFA